MKGRLFVLSVVPLLLNACILSSAAETLMTKREAFPANGIARARIETGAGELTIRGRRGASSIEVVADYKGDPEAKKDILDNLKLTMEIRSDTFFLKTENVRSVGWKHHGWIDVDITLPPGITLDVQDGSGSLSISGMETDVAVHDGSGQIDVEAINGNLRIQDGSGSIRVRNIGKNVEIKDGSGQIDVDQVRGDVQIRDGSGSIQVNDVAGSLIVPDDGSGSISHKDVRGRIEVPRRRRSD